MFSDAEITIFQEELEEKLQIINDNILLLEQQQATPEVIQEIFRSAHTIKGSSAVMGYDKMTELTHEIESIFDEIRQNRLGITSGLVDLLFEAMDTLTELKEEIINGTANNTDITPILSKITGVRKNSVEYDNDSGNKGLINDTEEIGAMSPIDMLKKDTSIVSGAAAPLPDIEIDNTLEEVIREAELRGYYTYALQIRFDEDCQMKEVRAFLLYETMEQAGEIIRTEPSIEDIQNGFFDNTIALAIITRADMDQVKNLALSVAEIHSVNIRLLDTASTANTVPETTVDYKLVDVNKPNSVSTTAQATAAPGKPAGQDKKTIKTVRVDVEKLDTLMNLVGELVIDRTRLERFVDVFENSQGSDELVEDILEISNHLGQVTTDLQDEIMKARMLPVAQVFNRFPRMVRDIAHKLNKDIEFQVTGKETELDRNVIEVIGDPLIHLLRNSIDHGIEEPQQRQRLGKPSKGLLQLKAAYVESHILITVEDDGRGIDVQKLKDKALKSELISPEKYRQISDREAMDLIFNPGFSTVEENRVSNISGRGVGMDIVRTQIESINGTVDYVTQPDKGTRFFIKLPLTLAIIRAMMVEHAGRTYAFPLTYVVETLNLSRSEIRKIRHSEVIVVRGQVYPLKRLEDIFNLVPGETGNKVYVIIVGSGERKVGVVVDRLLGEQEIVIKSLGAYLGQVEGLAGAAILGDGKVSLIIDVRGLLRNMGAEEALAIAAVN